MDYVGLTRDDLANVRALNAAWLDLENSAPHARRLTPQRRERLAATPFLLFSFREHDDRLWDRLLDGRRQPDLLAGWRDDEQRRTLQATGIGFLWELSRRNPYVARLVSIAPLHWCERLAAMTLCHLQEAVARQDIIELRFDADSPQYRRLLHRGGSVRGTARRSAQIAALQSLLTQGDIAQYGRLAAAACRMRQPSRQVADEV